MQNPTGRFGWLALAAVFVFLSVSAPSCVNYSEKGQASLRAAFAKALLHKSEKNALQAEQSRMNASDASQWNRLEALALAGAHCLEFYKEIAHFLTRIHGGTFQRSDRCKRKLAEIQDLLDEQLAFRFAGGETFTMGDFLQAGISKKRNFLRRIERAESPCPLEGVDGKRLFQLIRESRSVCEM